MASCSKCGGDVPRYRNDLCPTCWNAYTRDYRKRKLASETDAEREERLAERRLRRYGRTARARQPVTIPPEEYARLKARRYYERHREERIAYQKARRESDIEAAKERERATYRRNREKVQARNRARERGLGHLNAESVEYEAVLRRDPCCYCGGRTEHIDHIVPAVAGGDNHWTNLTAACQPCNRKKWAAPLLAYLGAAR